MRRVFQCLLHSLRTEVTKGRHGHSKSSGGRQRKDKSKLPGRYLDGRAMSRGFDENAQCFKLEFLDPTDRCGPRGTPRIDFFRPTELFCPRRFRSKLATIRSSECLRACVHSQHRSDELGAWRTTLSSFQLEATGRRSAKATKICFATWHKINERNYRQAFEQTRCGEAMTGASRLKRY